MYWGYRYTITVHGFLNGEYSQRRSNTRKDRCLGKIYSGTDATSETERNFTWVSLRYITKETFRVKNEWIRINFWIVAHVPTFRSAKVNVHMNTQTNQRFATMRAPLGMK